VSGIQCHRTGWTTFGLHPHLTDDAAIAIALVPLDLHRLASDLKRIYASATVNEAEQRLGEFEAKWDDAYLQIGQSWRRNWSRIIPFFDSPPEIRKVIYTTNASRKWTIPIRDWKAALTRFTSEYEDRVANL
jgi:putative transposase